MIWLLLALLQPPSDPLTDALAGFQAEQSGQVWTPAVRGPDRFYFVEGNARVMNWSADASGALTPSESIQPVLEVMAGSAYLISERADCRARTLQPRSISTVDAQGVLAERRELSAAATPVVAGDVTTGLLEAMCAEFGPEGPRFQSTAAAIEAARAVLSEERPR